VVDSGAVLSAAHATSSKDHPATTAKTRRIATHLTPPTMAPTPLHS
jgi:hypothetical protein